VEEKNCEDRYCYNCDFNCERYSFAGFEQGTGQEQDLEPEALFLS
jgi:hypothetical protein